MFNYTTMIKSHTLSIRKACGNFVHSKKNEYANINIFYLMYALHNTHKKMGTVQCRNNNENAN